MKVAVLTFPGSNCDVDCFRAIAEIPGLEPSFVWHRTPEVGAVAAIVLPGGFAHGDYLRAGAIARFSPVMASVIRFAQGGGPVIGICNGFQILCESGLLPGAFLRNDTLRFRSRTVTIRVETTDSPFTSRYEVGALLRIPIAHGEGNYFADAATLARLSDEDRIAFRYTTATGETEAGSNPNGSADNIAGILNEGRNVLGMMPHPERAMEGALGSADGRGVFESLAAHLTGALR